MFSSVQNADAVKQGVARVTDTVSDVAGAWIKDQSVIVVNGRVTEYRVSRSVTFLLNAASAQNKRRK